MIKMKNAFNQKTNNEYSYQAEDVKRIGESLLNSYSHIVLVEPLSNAQLDSNRAIMAPELRTSLLQGKTLIGAYNTSDNHWIAYVIAPVREDDARISSLRCYYKDSLNRVRNDFERLIADSFDIRASKIGHKAEQIDQVSGAIFALRNMEVLAAIPSNVTIETLDLQFYDPTDGTITLGTIRDNFAAIYLDSIVRVHYTDKVHHILRDKHVTEISTLQSIIERLVTNSFTISISADSNTLLGYKYNISFDRTSLDLPQLEEIRDILRSSILSSGSSCEYDDITYSLSLCPGDVSRETQSLYDYICRNNMTPFSIGEKDLIEMVATVLRALSPKDEEQLHCIETKWHDYGITNVIFLEEREMLSPFLERLLKYDDISARAQTIATMLRCGITPNFHVKYDGECRPFIERVAERLRFLQIKLKDPDAAAVQEIRQLHEDLKQILSVLIDYGVRLNTIEPLQKEVCYDQSLLETSKGLAKYYTDIRYDAALRSTDDLLAQQATELDQKIKRLEYAHESLEKQNREKFEAFSKRLENIPAKWWDGWQRECVDEGLLKRYAQLQAHIQHTFSGGGSDSTSIEHFYNLYTSFCKLLQSQLRIAIQGISAAASEVVSIPSSSPLITSLLENIPYVGEMIAAGVDLLAKKQQIIECAEKVRHFEDNHQQDVILRDYAARITAFRHIEIAQGLFAPEEDAIGKFLPLLKLTAKAVWQYDTKAESQDNNIQRLKNLAASVLWKAAGRQWAETFFVKHRDESELLPHWESLVKEYVLKFVKYLHDTPLSYLDSLSLGEDAAAAVIPEWYFTQKIVLPTVASTSSLKGFNCDHALTLANIANLSYANWAMIDYYLSFHNEEDIKYHILDKGNLRALIVKNTSSFVIAFRGSDNVTNWFRNNFDGVRTADIAVGEKIITVHNGFRNAVHTLWAEIYELVEEFCTTSPSGRFYITGHSLGGAMAGVTYLYLLATKKVEAEQIDVYTFAQPKWCTKQSLNDATSIISGNYHRIVGHQDIVPRLYWEVAGYGHIGPEYDISISKQGILMYPPGRIILDQLLIQKGIDLLHRIPNLLIISSNTVDTWFSEVLTEPILNAHSMDTYTKNLRLRVINTSFNGVISAIEQEESQEGDVDTTATGGSYVRAEDITTRQSLANTPQERWQQIWEGYLSSSLFSSDQEAVMYLTLESGTKYLNLNVITGGRAVESIPHIFMAQIPKQLTQNHPIFSTIRSKYAEIEHRQDEIISIVVGFAVKDSDSTTPWVPHTAQFIECKKQFSVLPLPKALLDKVVLGVLKLEEAGQALVLEMVSEYAVNEAYKQYWSQYITQFIALYGEEYKTAHRFNDEEYIKHIARLISAGSIEGLDVDETAKYEKVLLLTVLYPDTNLNYNWHSVFLLDTPKTAKLYELLFASPLPTLPTKYGIVINHEGVTYIATSNNYRAGVVMEELEHALLSRKMTPSCFIKLKGYGPRDFSQTVSYKALPGEIKGDLYQILSTEPNRVHSFDQTFSEIFLLTIISNGGYYHPSNYAVLEQNNNLLTIVELVKQPQFNCNTEPILRSDDITVTHWHILPNIIFCFPQMGAQINRDLWIFLTSSPIKPAEIIINWLQHLHKKNIEYCQVESGLNADELNELGLPLYLPVTAVHLAYHRLCTIYKLCLEEKTITHDGLLKKIMPHSGTYHELIRNTDPLWSMAKAYEVIQSTAISSSHLFCSREKSLEKLCTLAPENELMEELLSIDVTATNWIASLDFTQFSAADSSKICTLIGRKLFFLRHFVLCNINLPQFNELFSAFLEYAPPEGRGLVIELIGDETDQTLLKQSGTSLRILQNLHDYGAVISKISLERPVYLSAKDEPIISGAKLAAILASKIHTTLQLLERGEDAVISVYTSIINNLLDISQIISRGDISDIRPLREMEVMKLFVTKLVTYKCLKGLAVELINRNLLPFDEAKRLYLLHEITLSSQEEEYLDLTAKLVHHSPDLLSHRDKAGRLAVDVAMQNNNYKIAAVIVNHGGFPSCYIHEDRLIVKAAHLSMVDQQYRLLLQATPERLEAHKFFLPDCGNSLHTEGMEISVLHIALLHHDEDLFHLGLAALKHSTTITPEQIFDTMWSVSNALNMNMWSLARQARLVHALETIYYEWGGSTKVGIKNLHNTDGYHILADEGTPIHYLSKLRSFVHWPLTIEEVLSDRPGSFLSIINATNVLGNNVLYELLKRTDREYESARLKKDATVEWLLSHGIDPCVSTRIDSRTVLDLVKTNGTDSSITALIEHYQGYDEYSNLLGEV